MEQMKKRVLDYVRKHQLITNGDHVIVGANAVVIRDVQPGCTVGGVPAKVLRVHSAGQIES